MNRLRSNARRLITLAPADQDHAAFASLVADACALRPEGPLFGVFALGLLLGVHHVNWAIAGAVVTVTAADRRGRLRRGLHRIVGIAAAADRPSRRHTHRRRCRKGDRADRR